MTCRSLVIVMLLVCMGCPGWGQPPAGDAAQDEAYQIRLDRPRKVGEVFRIHAKLSFYHLDETVVDGEDEEELENWKSMADHEEEKYNFVFEAVARVNWTTRGNVFMESALDPQTRLTIRNVDEETHEIEVTPIVTDHNGDDARETPQESTGGGPGIGKVRSGR